jgi:hypothetical protein
MTVPSEVVIVGGAFLVVVVMCVLPPVVVERSRSLRQWRGPCKPVSASSFEPAFAPVQALVATPGLCLVMSRDTPWSPENRGREDQRATSP